MDHLPQIIQDLAFVLLTASISLIFFKLLKFPTVIGYIVTGILLGPYISWTPTVMDQTGVKLWGELGVIFMLFGLGLEFSFRKLFKLGGGVFLATFVEVSGVFTLSYVVLRLLNFEHSSSIFLAVALSISSTSIIIRSLEDLKLKNSNFSPFVFGLLVIEDFVAILMMVLLVSLNETSTSPIQASSGIFKGFTEIMPLVSSFSKLIIFMVVWGGLGIYAVPWIFDKFKKFFTDEVLTVVSVGLCLTMVVLASHFGLSSALGAFMMGSILAETSQNHKIESLFSSIKNLFSAVFFVSVGLLLNPKVFVEQWEMILILSATVVFGKFIFVSVGALLSGERLKKSWMSALSMTQIGEFSFVIAMLGVKLKVLSQEMYPLIIGVSTLTSFLTPFLIQLGQKIFKAPDGGASVAAPLARWIDEYHWSLDFIKYDKNWGVFIRAFIKNLSVNSIFIFVISVVVLNSIFPWVSEQFFSWETGSFISTVVTLIVVFPFIWSLSFGKIQNYNLISQYKFNNSRVFQGIFAAIRWSISVFWILFILRKYFSGFEFAVVLVFVMAGGFIFKNKLWNLFLKLEQKMYSQKHKKENLLQGVLQDHTSMKPWDIEVTQMRVGERSVIIGETLGGLQLREKWKVSVAFIHRVNEMIAAPVKSEIFMPHDVLYLIGEEEDLLKFKNWVEIEKEDLPHEPTTVLHPIATTQHSFWLGKTLANTHFRERFHGMVVGIEKGGEKILNPESSVVLELGDILWILGDKQNMIKALQEVNHEN